MVTNRRRAALMMTALGSAIMAVCGCQTNTAGMTLPSPRYLQHYPQYFAPDPTFPLPRELASMEDPEGAAKRAGVGGAGVAPLAPAGQPVPVQGQ